MGVPLRYTRLGGLNVNVRPAGKLEAVMERIGEPDGKYVAAEMTIEFVGRVSVA